MKNGVNAIFDARAIGHERGAVGALSAHELGSRVREPDTGQEAGPKQLGEHEDIDAVGFDFGFGDDAGAHGIGDDDFFDEGLKDIDDGPGVGGGFDGDGEVAGKVFGGEGLKRGARGGEAIAVGDVSVVVDGDGLGDSFVEIESSKWHTEFTPKVQEGGPGGLGAKLSLQLTLANRRGG